MENISTGVFAGCSNLTDVYFSGTKTEAEAILLGTGNTYLSSATWHCSDGDSEGIGPTSGTCGSKLTWALSSDGTLTISGTGAMSNYTSSSGTPWEAKKSSIKKLVVNSGVTSIGDYALSGCSNLTSVSLPSGLKTLGSYAFSGCNFVSITLPNTVTSIGNHCFNWCERLRNITLSSSLITIGYNAFYECRVLSGIELPDSVTSIGTSTFEDCSNLQTVKLSEGMTEIPNRGFAYCALSEVIIPEGITSIGERAFSSNSTLTTLYLPLTLENISTGAFAGCSNLTDVYFSGTKTEAEAILLGTGNTYLSSATWHFNAGSTQSTTILTLPNMLSVIESEAFAGVNAQTIIIPASVDEIGSKAFANCPNLETLYFEGSPYSIALNILAGCSNVTVSAVQGSSAEKWAVRAGFPVVYH